MQTSPRVLIALLLVGLSVPSTVYGQSAAGPKQWLVDYDFARQEAKRLGLPLLIHFSATWCGPCQQMEHETLSKHALLSSFGTKLLALKVDSDEQPGLIQAFRVDSLPTDIIVSPDGHIVSRTQGYQSNGRYLANVKHWSQQFPDERAEALARLDRKVKPQTPAVKPSTTVAEQSQQPIVSRPENPTPPAANIAQAAETEASPVQLVGLAGYSPVAIKKRRVWAKGREDLAVTWQGVVYYLANDREYIEFKKTPHRYAPRMLGCDPVLLWNSDRAVQGAVEYGAFYDGELYLFTTKDTRDQFKVDPDQFVQVRHALAPEEVIGTRVR